MLDVEPRYQRAEQLLRWHLNAKLTNRALYPHWLDDHRFWFARELPFDKRIEGEPTIEYKVVDTQALTLSPYFDKPLDMPVTISGNLQSVASPNGRYQVINQDHNLILKNSTTGEEKTLTHDGERHYAYGAYSDFMHVSVYENAPLPLNVRWSADSRWLAVQRIDERNVKNMPLQQCVSKDGSLRPVNHPYKMDMPGDKEVAQASLCVIDCETGERVYSDRPPVPASAGGFFDLSAIEWGADNCVYHTEWTRDRKTVRLVVFDPVNQRSRVLVEESHSGPTHAPTHCGPMPFETTLFKILADSNEFIWYSHRSGWGHLYRYDLTTGQLKNAITSGDFVVTELHHVNSEQGFLLFTGGGREQDRNPYYEHLYRVNLDGSELLLLTPEDCQHDIVPGRFVTEDFQFARHVHGVSPDGRVFIDTMSRVDKPTKSVLRSAIDGRELLTLSECDASQLTDTPYTLPMSFTAKAADHSTDLWGVIHRPSDFDASHSYPVILAIYGGWSYCVVPKRFAEFEQYVGKVARTLAELGCIVVTVDPRGTPYRSKAFQDEIYGNVQNGGGIEDQVAVLKQLGERYSWMDLDRVGITGHSSGGFSSARAMLSHPEFFKVAVSSGGAHDLQVYSAGMSEAIQGYPDAENYTAQASRHLAANLSGKLFLIHGDLDANVHIAQTLQLVDQLIQHNKHFDLLILPNRGHHYMDDPYFIRRVWDYFVEHLLNEQPPENYCIKPMDSH